MPRVDYFDDAAAPPANSLVPSVTAVVVAPNLAFLDEEPEEAPQRAVPLVERRGRQALMLSNRAEEVLDVLAP